MTALFVTTFELLIRWLVLNVREDRALRIARARLQGLERMFPFLLAGHLSLNVEDLKPSFPLPDSTEGFYLPSRMHWFFRLSRIASSALRASWLLLMQRCFMSCVVYEVKHVAGDGHADGKIGARPRPFTSALNQMIVATAIPTISS
jgi:hypothetical protein